MPQMAGAQLMRVTSARGVPVPRGEVGLPSDWLPAAGAVPLGVGRLLWHTFVMVTQPTRSVTPGSGDAVDFFVSYVAQDRAWAEWIAWELEAAGHRVRIEAWDFGPGSHRLTELQNAERDAARTVVVLSAAYQRSAFASVQWHSAWLDDPTGQGHRLLTVRVEDHPVTGLLGQVVTVDLVGVDPRTARERLLAAAADRRGKPRWAPPFPGGAPPVTGPVRPGPLFPGPPFPVGDTGAAPHLGRGRRGATPPLVAVLALTALPLVVVALVLTRSTGKGGGVTRDATPPPVGTVTTTSAAGGVAFPSAGATSPPGAEGADDGLSFALRGVRCGESTSGIVTAGPGEELCIVSVTARNGGTTLATFVDQYQHLVDAGNRRYPASAVGDTENFDITVAAGASAPHTLVFEVPRATIPDHLELQEGMANNGGVRLSLTAR